MEKFVRKNILISLFAILMLAVGTFSVSSLRFYDEFAEVLCSSSNSVELEEVVEEPVPTYMVLSENDENILHKESILCPSLLSLNTSRPCRVFLRQQKNRWVSYPNRFISSINKLQTIK